MEEKTRLNEDVKKGTYLQVLAQELYDGLNIDIEDVIREGFSSTSGMREHNTRAFLSNLLMEIKRVNPQFKLENKRK